jgi:hypothetical protein
MLMAKFGLPIVLIVTMWILFGNLAAGPVQDPKQQMNSFGSSGGNALDSIAGKCCSGTLGALVFSGSRKYILSANHVIGMMGKATAGDPISQPGLIDQRCSVSRTVGHFTVASPLADNVDAAIAELVDGTMDPTGKILGIGVPLSAIVDPEPNLKVAKSGRTTGVTHGTIQSYSTSLKVDYSGGCRSTGPSIVPFDNQIVIQGQSGAFASSADSGALVLTEDRHPVGLVVAGSDTLTVANPIREVLGSLSNRLGKALEFGTGPGLETYSAELQLPAPLRKALTEKEGLFTHFAAEPSVVGVGVAGQTEEGEPQLIVYVHGEFPAEMMQAAGISLDAAGEPHYQGTKTMIVKTSPIRAFDWNEEDSTGRRCPY